MADVAGIKPGDIVAAVKGQKVQAPMEAKVLMFGEVGELLTITVERDNKEMEFTYKRMPYVEMITNISK